MKNHAILEEKTNFQIYSSASIDGDVVFRLSLDKNKYINIHSIDTIISYVAITVPSTSLPPENINFIELYNKNKVAMINKELLIIINSDST